MISKTVVVNFPELTLREEDRIDNLRYVAEKDIAIDPHGRSGKRSLTVELRAFIPKKEVVLSPLHNIPRYTTPLSEEFDDIDYQRIHFY